MMASDVVERVGAETDLDELPLNPDELRPLLNDDEPEKLRLPEKLEPLLKLRPPLNPPPPFAYAGDRAMASARQSTPRFFNI